MNALNDGLVPLVAVACHVWSSYSRLVSRRSEGEKATDLDSLRRRRWLPRCLLSPSGGTDEVGWQLYAGS